MASGRGGASSLAVSSTISRIGTPTWTAASPTPGAAYMVSSMSSIRERSSSSTRRTGSLALRSRRSGKVMMGRFFAMRLK